MIRLIAGSLITAFAAILILGASSPAAEDGGPPLAHMVFFALKDHSETAREAFVASCQKYLTEHEGTMYFSVGTIAEDVEEKGVSVKDFDVALHVVFANKAAKEAYLVNPRHKQFVDENKASFAKVRVFDSYLEKKGK